MKFIKAPSLNGLGKTEGCEKAPEKIISSLKEFYLNESGILPVFELKDVAIDNSNIEKNNKAIYEKVKLNLDKTDKTIILGGDHSITYPCFKAFSECYNNPGLIVFDAHPDLMHNFNPPTHEDYLKTLIEEGHLKKEDIILVGLRNWHKDEYDYLTKNNIRYFNMKKISDIGIKELSETLMMNARKFEALYLSIDIDVADPSFAPGTGYIEPAGLTSRELLFLLQKLNLLKNIKAIDLVEINPDKDINEITSKLGAKILTELS